MTEIDAIKNLKAYMYYAFDELPEDVGKAISVALAALREMAERDKGCDYCNSDYEKWVYRDVDYSHQRSKYCPMCGRRLEDKHEAN